MKRLTKIVPGLTLLALLFATPAAVAEETIMVCSSPDDKKNLTLKYVDTSHASPKAYLREPRGWADLSQPHPDKSTLSHEYEVGDQTVFKTIYRDKEAGKGYPHESLQEGDKYRVWSTLEADFEFLKLTFKNWTTKVDGSPLGKGYSRKNPHIYKITCKKDEPDKPVK